MTTVSQPADAVKELLLQNLRRGNDLRETNRKLQEENERLRREHQRISAELKRYAAGKEALEAELYSRFVLVLNEKKAKIRSLQKAVDNLQERTSDKDKPEESMKSKESDEYEGTTDEEPEQMTTGAPCLPSQESSTPSPLNDSLSDITDVAPSRKRRFRQLDTSSSGAKLPNSETSQKKSNASPAGCSAASQRSADAAKAPSSAEDLFDDF